MSLNGLDDAKIREAHEAAVAEPGGWFLLKYASRDELEILGRGNGGIVEIRNNIAQHEEKSPLYGFLRYRRRNVIIKYLPEDCSRLIQARVSVHFNTICDRFAPYDTAFSIANHKELKDTKLSAACSLHAASGSTSSSTSSLRRRRLMEIAEEEEEEERERKRQSVVKEESISGKEDPTTPASPTTTLSPKITLNSDLANSPKATEFSGTRDPPQFSGIVRPPSPAKSFDEAARRLSSQTARPDLYSYSSYPYSKPKVKLAPRPSLDVNGHPSTSGGAGIYRPISALPAGFKLFSRKSKSQDKPGGSAENSIKEESEPRLLPPSIPENRPAEGELTRPHTSSGAHGSTNSLSGFGSVMESLPPPLPAAAKKNTISPEKARLMKAMKLREKKKMMSSQPTPDLLAVETPQQRVTLEVASKKQLADSISIEESPAGSDLHLDNRLSRSKADSGIDIDVSNDQVSVHTLSDSHPTSPIAASSDIGESTQASSLSESTDETVHPSGGLKEPGGAEDEEDEEEVAEELMQREDPAAEEEISPDNPTTTSLEPREDGTEEAAEPESHPALASEAAPEPEDDARDGDDVPEPASKPALEQIQTDFQEKALVRSPILPVSKFSTTSPRAAEMPETGSEGAQRNEDAPRDADGPIPHEGGETKLPQSPQLPIPLSKFSTRETRSPISPTVHDIPSVLAPSLVTPEPASSGDDALPAAGGGPDDVAETASIETRRSRRKHVEPIRTDLEIPGEKGTSDADWSEDDDLMDELQSATLEEAKPMMVSKSPIMPLFPGNSPPKRSATGLEGDATTPRSVLRTVSNPVRGGLLAPGDVTTSSARSISSGAAYLHKITQQPSSSDLRPKSAKIGSSISQRIKALERLSTTPGGPEGSERKDRPSSTFFSVRKPNTREPSRSPSVVDRATSLTRGTSPSPGNSRESSPETSKFRRDRSGSMASRLSVFEGGAIPRGRPESIQVTARIIREPGQQFPRVPEFKTDATDYVPLDLKQSPLVVDHQKATPGTSPAPTPTPEAQQEKEQNPPERRLSLLQRRFSKGRRSQSEDRETIKAAELEKDETEEPRPRRRSSLTIVKDFIKDRRGSILSGKSVSTDNLNLTINPASGNLASPALPTPSRSPSRPPSVHHNSLFPRRLSISSRRSSLDQKSPGPPPTGISGEVLSPSLMTEASGESEGEGKKSAPGSASGSNAGSTTTSPNPAKSNRASRFMRRLSNSLSSGRKTITPSISPTVAEEDAAEVEAAGQGIPPSRGSTMTGTYMQPTIVSYMGDVNVQFPDTLLWKRRTMCLDSQGFLILSAIQGVTATTPVAAAAAAKDRHHQAGAIKRYHLSDFKPPFIPEIEVQELPNSVVLDFVDGSGIQIACEDRAGQLSVLHVLEDAHQSHTSFGL
ncbi:hypothetical protein GQ53DRAFT_537705 [Thozetella sp. PMI_491]|nr:hypothetical protein GQ53DRAFT_537705 [Thozetella sp. PMI_491]